MGSLSELRQLLENARSLHQNVGQDMADLGGVLRCCTCGHESRCEMQNDGVCDFIASDYCDWKCLFSEDGAA